LAWAAWAAWAASGCDAIIGIEDVPTPLGAADGAPDVLGPADSTTRDVAPDVASAPEAGAGDAACPDTRSDPHNCGACGHDCLGGLCSMSACQPMALVAVEAGASPYAIAQDDGSLYWTDDRTDTIWATNKRTGASEPLQQGTFSPEPIAVDDAGIYWGAATGVYRCPKVGCATGTTFIGQYSGFLVDSLSVDDQNVYWIEGQLSVAAAPKGSLDASANLLWPPADAAASAAPVNVVADGTHVFFSATDGLVRSLALDGGQVASTGSPSSYGSFGLALDPADVYWTVPDPSEGYVSGSPSSALDASVLAMSQASPGAIASDGTRLYWVVAEDAGATTAIAACTIAACAPSVMAAGFTDVSSIVVDDTAVYFTDHGTGDRAGPGAIWKLAK
jgi:hypothetical protein